MVIRWMEYAFHLEACQSRLPVQLVSPTTPSLTYDMEMILLLAQVTSEEYTRTREDVYRV